MPAMVGPKSVPAPQTGSALVSSVPTPVEPVLASRSATSWPASVSHSRTSPAQLASSSTPAITQRSRALGFQCSYSQSTRPTGMADGDRSARTSRVRPT